MPDRRNCTISRVLVCRSLVQQQVQPGWLVWLQSRPSARRMHLLWRKGWANMLTWTAAQALGHALFR